MLESNFTRLIINDILSTEDYNLQGISMYTNTHIDVIREIVAGRTAPSISLFKRIIDLHWSVRRGLYDGIIKKITTQYLTPPSQCQN